MHDTVELLESIGRDATLRRASPAVLAKALEAANASVGLRELVVHGDGTALTKELGLEDRYVEHQSQVFAADEDLLLN